MDSEESLEGELGGVWGTLPWAASNAPEPCPQQQASSNDSTKFSLQNANRVG